MGVVLVVQGWKTYQQIRNLPPLSSPVFAEAILPFRIRLANQSPYLLHQAQMEGQDFGDLPSGKVSAYRAFRRAYRHESLTLKVNGRVLTYRLGCPVGENLQTPGTYTLELNAYPQARYPIGEQMRLDQAGGKDLSQQVIGTLLQIEAVYRIKGRGQVIVAKLLSGSVTPGMRLLSDESSDSWRAERVEGFFSPSMAAGKECWWMKPMAGDRPLRVGEVFRAED